MRQSLTRSLDRNRRRLAIGLRARRRLERFLRTERGLRVLEYLQRHRLLMALYFHFQGTFWVEQREVLAGQISYHRQLLQPSTGVPLYTLRRNIHRLEKGISVPNRRPVFATGYIQETIDLLERLVQMRSARQDLGDLLSSTIQWGADVLAQYFEVVDETEVIGQAKKRFQLMLSRYELAVGSMYPHVRQRSKAPPVAYDGLLCLAWQRRSVRRYRSEAVPRELIDKALEVAKLSPSACNRQAFEFRIYDEPSLVQKLVELPGGMSGYGEGVPCVVVLVGEQGAYFHERDRHVIYIDASLAAMAFQFALETLGLSSCCVNWPNLPEKDRSVAELLSLTPDERVIMLIAVGFPDPDGLIPFSNKKTLDEIRSFNKT
jgi:nitroreductase